jgi:hypothetical protein
MALSHIFSTRIRRMQDHPPEADRHDVFEYFALPIKNTYNIRMEV